MYILLLHTQVIGLGTLGLVYTLSTEALPRMEATRGKVKAWRVDSLRSGDLEEVNSKAMPISCEQLRFQDQGSSEKLGSGHGVGVCVLGAATQEAVSPRGRASREVAWTQGTCGAATNRSACPAPPPPPRQFQNTRPTSRVLLLWGIGDS